MPEDAGLESPSTEDATAPVEQQSAPVDNSTPGINPAWNDLLEALPSSLHSQAIPHLKKWDEGVQNRLTEVQSRYEPYKPIVEAGTNPDEIMASVQLAQMIANDPRAFYDRMTSYYGEQWGLSGGQGQTGSSDADDGYSLDDPDDDDGQDDNPVLRQLQEQQKVLADVLTAQLQEKEAAQQKQIQDQADAKLNSDIEALSTKYGEIDQDTLKIILSVAVNSNDNDLNKAAELVMGRMGQKIPAPPVMSPGGGLPSYNVDPATLDSKATRSLVTEILKQRAAQNG